MDYDLSLAPVAADIEKVVEILMAFNVEHIETTESTEVALYAREQGEIVAGITGRLFGNWLLIKYLAVNESLRGQGIGKKLLADLEQAAKDHGCRYSMVYTLGFQAKDFYQKYGYVEVFTMKNFPLTGTEHYLVKEF